MSKKDKRTFTIQGSDIGYGGGRYTGDGPGVAARHAAKQLVRMVENKKKLDEFKQYAKFASSKSIKFIIREITRGSNKTSYYYEATVVPLPTPKVIVRNGIEITVTKTIIVKTCNDSMNTVSRSPKSA